MSTKIDTKEFSRTLSEESKIDELVEQFSEALYNKLLASEEKYNWAGGWRYNDWHRDLLEDLRTHVDKGDPLDVAAYAAFAWYHNWSTAKGSSVPVKERKEVTERVKE